MPYHWGSKQEGQTLEPHVVHILDHMVGMLCIKYELAELWVSFMWVLVKPEQLVLGLPICLPVQETRVQSLIREDSTWLGATKPVGPNY